MGQVENKFPSVVKVACFSHRWSVSQRWYSWYKITIGSTFSRHSGWIVTNCIIHWCWIFGLSDHLFLPFVGFVAPPQISCLSLQGCISNFTPPNVQIFHKVFGNHFLNKESTFYWLKECHPWTNCMLPLLNLTGALSIIQTFVNPFFKANWEVQARQPSKQPKSFTFLLLSEPKNPTNVLKSSPCSSSVNVKYASN